jgi:flagellar FliJ protein
MSPLGRFRFPLETLLRVRKLKEEQARLQLGRSLLNLERSHQALQHTERLFGETLRELRANMSEALAAQDYQMHTLFLEHLKEAVQGWRNRIEQEQAEIAQLKLHLQKLHQERRLLSNLREKKFAQFQRELARTLEKEVEEGVLQRWLR